MTDKTILGFFHYGLAVRDIEVAIEFFRDALDFNLVAERRIEAPYIHQLVGTAGVSAKVAMLEFPGGGFLELLEWSGNLRSKFTWLKKVTLTQVGAQHLCVYVQDLDQLFTTIATHPRIHLISDVPVTVTHGPNKGAKVLFIKFDNVLYIELFEKPKSG